MDIGVAIFPEKLEVRLQRIMDFDLGRRAFAGKRVVIAGRIAHRDVEVVDPSQRSREGLAGGQRYGHRYRAARRSRSALTASTGPASAAAQAAASRPSAQSATLLVTPEEARRIELAKNLGKISLSLRNPLDTAATPEDVANATTPEEIGIVPPAPPVRPAPRVVQVAAPRPAPPPKEKVVEVFHGATHVQQAFK